MLVGELGMLLGLRLPKRVIPAEAKPAPLEGDKLRLEGRPDGRPEGEYEASLGLDICLLGLSDLEVAFGTLSVAPAAPAAADTGVAIGIAEGEPADAPPDVSDWCGWGGEGGINADGG